MSYEYSPADYDGMFADDTRRPAYLEAIKRAVQPGDVVVEVGTGVGYFAVAAIRAGARHVYAIERTPSILLAKQVIAENGLTSCITCIHGDAGSVVLPERGSLYLADLRGMLPLSGDAIPTVAAVRSRLLKPGARMIPVRDTIYAAPCQAPARWRNIEVALEQSSEGIARSAVARFARATPRQCDVALEELVAPGAVVAVLDFATIVSPDIDATVEWVLTGSGVVEGIALWFEADLGNGVRMSTAPGGPSSVYANGFLPFAHALAATAGDRISCRIRAKLAGGDYVYAWDTTWTPQSRSDPVTMRQSALGALLIDPATMQRRKGSHVPAPGTTGQVAELLDLVDGSRSQWEIARELTRLHPGRFRSDAEALTWVTEVLGALEQVRGGGGAGTEPTPL